MDVITGVCKISDFGISKRTDDQNDAHTAMQGTVFWMAPEVINTKKKGYSFKIDIWSIGCVVLEMWAGTRPWLGDEVVAVMFKLYQSKQPPPVPDGLVLTPLADDFREKCFAMCVFPLTPLIPYSPCPQKPGGTPGGSGTQETPVPDTQSGVGV
jgi:mitogen-activated protein kinase kinase kinase